MRYAQIKDGIIQNIIKLNDPSLKPLFKEGFDELVPLNFEHGGPNIGWRFEKKAATFGSPQTGDYVKMDLKQGKKLIAVEASRPFVAPEIVAHFKKEK